MEPIRVLIIEDDPAIAQVNKQFVEKVAGYEVVGIATRHEEVRVLWPLLRPHLILLDIYFPDTNGLQMLKEIRSQDSSVDVIMITAAKEVDALREALSGGVFDYIVKPILFPRFQETLLRYRKMRGQLEKLKGKEGFTQDDIDALLMGGGNRGYGGERWNLPKGIDALTLDKVLAGFSGAEDRGYTADEIGRRCGISRTTARRYLEYLVSLGEVKAALEYGTVGRPERLYRRIRV